VNADEIAIPKPIDAEAHEANTGHHTQVFYVGMTLEVDWRCTGEVNGLPCRACKADPTWGEEATA
jgi:hypothetical protein